MSGPVRIQLRRTKGWRMPENTVVVSRPRPWGNPFVVNERREPGAKLNGEYWAVADAEEAVECYRLMFEQPGERADTMRASLPELRGKNLACWCKLTDPCHADVLLELANAPTPTTAKAG